MVMSMKFNDVKNPYELHNYMKANIKYGFYSTFDMKVHRRLEMDDYSYENLLFSYYYLQKPEELLITKTGICYDQVEFERKWFLDHNYEVHTFYTPYHNHCFLIFKDRDYYYLFETCIKDINGIYIGETLEELLDYYRILQNNFDMKFYEYSNVNYGCNFYDFISNIIPSKDFISKLKQTIDESLVRKRKLNIVNN